MRNLARLGVYQDTLALVADHPVVGVGPGMYVWRFRPYQTVDGDRLYDHAHNDYLETAAEWGIVAAVAVWGFVFWRFLQANRVFLTSRSTGRQGLALGCAAGIFSVLVHSLVDFSLQLPAILMIFCTVVGLAWSLDLVDSRPRIVPVDDLADSITTQATPLAATAFTGPARRVDTRRRLVGCQTPTSSDGGNATERRRRSGESRRDRSVPIPSPATYSVAPIVICRGSVPLLRPPNSCRERSDSILIIGGITSSSVGPRSCWAI